MREVVRGQKYDFEIVSEQEGTEYLFFIMAKPRSGRASCINNLNVILSELGIEDEDPKFEDSTWIVTEQEAKYFVNTARELVSDPVSIKYLERQLDEDRRLGEWEMFANPVEVILSWFLK